MKSLFLTLTILAVIASSLAETATDPTSTDVDAQPPFDGAETETPGGSPVVINNKPEFPATETTPTATGSSVVTVTPTAAPKEKVTTLVINDQPEFLASTKTPEVASTKKPEEVGTTKKPETDATTKKPESDATTKKPETDATTKKPETDATTKKPEEVATTKKPETDATSKKPETEATTKAADDKATTAKTNVNGEVVPSGEGQQGLTTTQLSLIVVGSVLGAGLVVGAAIMSIKRCKSTRDRRGLLA